MTQRQAQTFFIDAQGVYQKIVHANHMHHQELYSVLGAFMSQLIGKNASLLDLGCGDAGMIKGALQEAQVARYRGVDLSDIALAQAEENLQPLGISVNLTCTDMLDYVKTPSKDQFDVVFSGYALHHLDETGKADFISAAISHLKPRGILLIADVFREEGEPLSDYLERFCEDIRIHWSCLSADEIEHTENHVRSFDRPTTPSQLHKLARELSLPFKLIFNQGFYGMVAIGPLDNA